MPVWLTIILALGGSALISTIVGLIVNKVAKKIVAKEERYQQLNKSELARKEQEQDDKLEQELMVEMRKLVEPISKNIDSIREQLDLDKAATITSIRSTLKVLRDQYKKQGFADVGDKAIWNELYVNYKNMGGNHFKEYVDQWKLEVNNLPAAPEYDEAW